MSTHWPHGDVAVRPVVVLTGLVGAPDVPRRPPHHLGHGQVVRVVVPDLTCRSDHRRRTPSGPSSPSPRGGPFSGTFCGARCARRATSAPRGSSRGESASMERDIPAVRTRHGPKGRAAGDSTSDRRPPNEISPLPSPGPRGRRRRSCSSRFWNGRNCSNRS